MSKKVKRKTKYDGWLMQSSRIPLTINCDDEKLKDKHWQSFRDALKPFGEVGTIIVRQCAGLLWGLIARKRKNGVPVSIDSQMYSIISKFIDKNRKKFPKDMLKHTVNGWIKHIFSAVSKAFDEGAKIPNMINPVYPISYNAIKYKKGSDGKDIVDENGISIPELDENGREVHTNCDIKIEKRKDGKTYRYFFRIRGLKYKEQWDIEFGSVISHKNWRMIETMDRIISQEYKLCDSKIVCNAVSRGMNSIQKREKNGGGNTNYFLILSYKILPKINSLDKNKIFAVDMGVNFPLVGASNVNRYHPVFGDADEINGMRRMFFKLKKRNSRAGKGYFSKSEVNWSDGIYKKIAHHAVAKAVEGGHGTFRMEDLKGVMSFQTEFNKKMLWSPYALRKSIENCAKREGLSIEFANPKYTSARCSECGYTHPFNRMKGSHSSEFICRKCGCKMHADKNAASNIASMNKSQLDDGYEIDNLIPDDEIAPAWFRKDGKKYLCKDDMPYRKNMEHQEDAKNIELEEVTEGGVRKNVFLDSPMDDLEMN